MTTSAQERAAPAHAQSGHLCGHPSMGTYDGQVTLVAPDWLREKWPNGIGIDVCLALEIQELWRLGIRTNGHCCGHGRAPSYIGVWPESVSAMVAMGYRCLPGSDDHFVPKTRFAPVERAAPAQQPVAWRWRHVYGTKDRTSGWYHTSKPVTPRDPDDCWAGCEVQPLYTSPAEPELRAEIVSLTKLVDGIDEERRGALDLCIERNKEIAELQKRIEALSAEVGKLTEALKPFAREAEYWHGNAPIHIDLGCSESREAEFTPADLRRARDAIRSRAALDKGATT